MIGLAVGYAIGLGALLLAAWIRSRAGEDPWAAIGLYGVGLVVVGPIVAIVGGVVGFRLGAPVDERRLERRLEAEMDRDRAP